MVLTNNRAMRLLLASALFIILISSYALAAGEEGPGWHKPFAAAEKAFEAGRFNEAENGYREAIAIAEKESETSEDVAMLEEKLGDSYMRQMKCVKAENSFLHAATIVAWCHGPEDLKMAHLLSRLAGVYLRQPGHHPLAGATYQRALVIRENLLGPDHVEVADTLFDLGMALYFGQARLKKAVPMFERALHIYEDKLGPEHPKVAGMLSTLGFVHAVFNEFAEAVPLYERSVAIEKKAYGMDDSRTMTTLYQLASAYEYSGKPEKAEEIHKLRLAFLEKRFGPDHPNTAAALDAYSSLLLSVGREQEASEMRARADRIMGGPNHVYPLPPPFNCKE
jgi:tetratricopeptide (TPR) repeat protein